MMLLKQTVGVCCEQFSDLNLADLTPNLTPELIPDLNLSDLTPALPLT